MNVQDQSFNELLANSKNGMLEIEVRDTGIGIKKKDKSKLF